MSRIVVDTNLLLLLVVGLTDRELVEKHRRTRQFTVEDFDLLLGVLANYDEVVVTPHILTETSNLASLIADPDRSRIREKMGQLTQTQREIYELSARVSQSPAFVRLGLTDSAILSVIGEDMPFVTVDLALYLEAVKANHNALNFNHLRQTSLLTQ